MHVTASHMYPVSCTPYPNDLPSTLSFPLAICLFSNSSTTTSLKVWSQNWECISWSAGSTVSFKPSSKKEVHSSSSPKSQHQHQPFSPESNKLKPNQITKRFDLASVCLNRERGFGIQGVIKAHLVSYVPSLLLCLVATYVGIAGRAKAPRR